jgi:hypothetical protein
MAKVEFDYEPHPHVEKRKATKPELTDKTPALSLNERIGLFITKTVGNMWAAYLFVGVALISLPAAIASGNEIVIVAWIAQTFLQLVLLPIIIVGQNLQAAESEKRAIATYDDAGAILAEAKQLQEHLSVQDKTLNHLVERLGTLESQITKGRK